MNLVPPPYPTPKTPTEKLSPGKGGSQRDKVVLKYFPSLQSLREEGVRGDGGWKGGQGGLIGSGDSTVSTLGKD